MPNSEDLGEKNRTIHIANEDYGIFHDATDSMFEDLKLFENLLIPKNINNYYDTNDIKNGYIINMDGTNSTGYIYLPEELREEDLDRIISIVEEKKDYSYVILKSWIQVTDFITGKEVLDFLGKLKEQLNEKEEKTEEQEENKEENIEEQEESKEENIEEQEENKEEKEEVNEEVLAARYSYIRDLLKFTSENGISINQYYTMLGEAIKKGDITGIPEFESTNPFLTADDIIRLINSEDERIVEYFANTMNGVIKLNMEEMSKTNNDNLEKNQIINTSPETYIRALLTYIQENEMSLEDYYRSFAIMLRKGDLNSLPSFEQYNPFLNEDDLRRLLDEEDERIVDYFANTMTGVIKLNLENMNNLNNNQPQNNLNNTIENDDDKFNFNNLEMENKNPMPNLEDDSLELDEMSYLDDKTNYMSGIKITYINTDIINHMNGLAVIKEPRSGRINIYGYENDDINLAGKKVIENSANTIESGYYVNLSEYIGILAHGIEDQYGNNSNFAFVNEQGDYLNFYDVINNIMATCRNEGALRYGKEYKDANIGSYEELENQYTGSKGVFKGIELTKGLYVRRDILIDELNKYRVAITKENIDNISHVR